MLCNEELCRVQTFDWITFYKTATRNTNVKVGGKH